MVKIILDKIYNKTVPNPINIRGPVQNPDGPKSRMVRNPDKWPALCRIMQSHVMCATSIGVRDFVPVGISYQTRFKCWKLVITEVKPSKSHYIPMHLLDLEGLLEEKLILLLVIAERS
ncbi:hypothetical protein C1646_666911 [Rhizophagus diaphanus]|nr:hypothetical protein C1646_666911 [Rhizophagus diaphanus] [Rhizophagus sp. MUCL 43196]